MRNVILAIVVRFIAFRSGLVGCYFLFRKPLVLQGKLKHQPLAVSTLCYTNKYFKALLLYQGYV